MCVYCRIKNLICKNNIFMIFIHGFELFYVPVHEYYDKKNICTNFPTTIMGVCFFLFINILYIFLVCSTSLQAYYRNLF